MASRWVQDGFNIGFGCCTWLIDRCKIHRKKWYGFDIALDGFKMGSRWVQHRLWKKVSRWPQDIAPWWLGEGPNIQKMPLTKRVKMLTLFFNEKENEIAQDGLKIALGSE